MWARTIETKTEKYCVVLEASVALSNVENPDAYAEDVYQNGKCICTLVTFSAMETALKDFGGLPKNVNVAQTKVKAKCSSALCLAGGSMVFALVLFTTL
jgi:hypothetical protein